MRVFNNVKHRHIIHLKIGNAFSNTLTKLVLEAKASICSTITEKVLLYYCKCLAFVTVVIV